MIETNIDFDDLISFSLEAASREFRHTNEYHLLKEKIEQMEEGCKQRFGEDDIV